MTDRIKFIKDLLTPNTAALIENPSNRFYLTGFNSSDGYVVITKKSAKFLIDSRYYEAAKKAVIGFDVILLTSFTEQLKDILRSEDIRELLVETDYTIISKYLSLKENFGINISLDRTLDDALTDERAVKSDEELKNIISAQEITDKTFSYICERIEKGRTEREVMLDMEMYLRKLGSEGVAFDFIVVSGKNTSLPHGVPTNKPIESGDFVTMDFGAVVNGYRSDMTRTVCVGHVSDKVRIIYDTVLKAQTEAIKAAKAGIKCSDVDKIARDIINKAGFEGCFGHGLGHSVGIDIHEAPAFSPKCDKILKIGNIMTVEPGIYIYNMMGVRIEDMIYITESGNKNLTKSPKELIIL